MNQQTLRRDLALFVGLAYVFGFLAQGLFYLRPTESHWLVISMWTPALAVLLGGQTIRSLARRSLAGPDARYLPIAFALGVLPYAFIQALLYMVGQATFDSEQNLSRLPIVLIVNPIATSVFGALGEEIGWRGVLQPELRRRWSPLKADLVVGLIWAYWHLPANLAGHNGREHLALNAFVLFPLMTIGMTLAFGWLRSKCRGIWPCVYLHGTINAVSNFWLVNPSSELVLNCTLAIVWLGVGAFLATRVRAEGTSESG